MRPCSACVNGRYPEIVTATAKDFWLASIVTDFRAGFFSLRRRHGGSITMTNRTCITMPHPRTAKTLATEMPLKASCALAWLTFSQGIIASRMTEVTLAGLENLVTQNFTRGTHLSPFPTYMREKNKNQIMLKILTRSEVRDMEEAEQGYLPSPPYFKAEEDDTRRYWQD